MTKTYTVGYHWYTEDNACYGQFKINKATVTIDGDKSTIVFTYQDQYNEDVICECKLNAIEGTNNTEFKGDWKDPKKKGLTKLFYAANSAVAILTGNWTYGESGKGSGDGYWTIVLGIK